MITAYNNFREHAMKQASEKRLKDDRSAIGQAIRLMSKEYGDLGLNLTITQKQFDSARTVIRKKGLPKIEADILQRSGATKSDIKVFEKYMADANVLMSVRSVSVQNIFDPVAQILCRDDPKKNPK
jgi:hypothetical protein